MFTYLFFLFFVYNVHVYVCTFLHVYECMCIWGWGCVDMYMYEHACGGPVLMMGTILSCSSALFFETVSQSDLELADVVCLVSQSALGIFYLCLLGLEFQGSLMPSPPLYGFLEIWTLVLTLAQQTLGLLNHLPSPHIYLFVFIVCT